MGAMRVHGYMNIMSVPNFTGLQTKYRYSNETDM